MHVLYIKQIESPDLGSGLPRIFKFNACANKNNKSFEAVLSHSIVSNSRSYDFSNVCFGVCDCVWCFSIEYIVIKFL